MNNQIHILAPKAKRINSYHKKSDNLIKETDHTINSNVSFSKRKSYHIKPNNSKLSFDFLRFDFEENIDKFDVLDEVLQIISNTENDIPIQISRCENPFNKNLNLNDEDLDNFEFNFLMKERPTSLSYYSYIKTIRVLFQQYESKDKLNKSLFNINNKLNTILHISVDSQSTSFIKRISFKSVKDNIRKHGDVINDVNNTVK